MLLADLSSRFVNLPAGRVDAEIEDAQRRLCEDLGLDLCVLWQWGVSNPDVFTLTHHHRRSDGPPITSSLNAAENFPWSLREVLAGRRIIIDSVDGVPAGAERDQEAWRHFDIKSVAIIPLSAGGGAPFGVLSFHDLMTPRAWSEALVQRLQLVAQIFANAIVRKRTEQTLRESEERLSLAAEAAGAGTWVLDVNQACFWVSLTTMGLLGLPPGDRLGLETFIGLVHVDDRQGMRKTIASALESRQMTQVEYRIVRPDGQVRWMQSRGRLCHGETSTQPRLTGITSDITERLQVEHDLKAALAEVQRLRDRLQNENVYLLEQVRSEAGHGAIVGASEPVKRMLGLARKVGPTGSVVLITGETGTGKELLAQAIHDLSPRRRKLMVKVNCAALPAPLIESELFGREKGAYTGAMSQQVGRFEVANGSTIFLDEIGDLPLDLQVKLLRVLQDGQFERLGSHQPMRADVRVIAATNRDLAAMMREGKFREDLFHRLNVFAIETPPLRERIADIPLLAWTFVQEFNVKMGRAIDGIPKVTMARLKQYRWPGNIRELRNVIERSMIVSEGPFLKIEIPEPGALLTSPPCTLEDVERKHIGDVLERTHWRIRGKGGAAEILGLVPTTLYSRMKKLGIVRAAP